MDSSLRAELDALRSRAYGRSADSSLEPDAVQRLHELEERAREAGRVRPAEPVTTAEPPASADEAPPTSFRALPEAQMTQETSPVRTRSDRRERWSRRRPGRLLVALWALSVATSAALAAAATFATVGILPVAVSNDAPQIVTLEPDPAVVVPVGFFGSGASSATYEFYGLTLFETSSGMFGGSGGGDCFGATLSSDVPEEENVQGGFSASGPFYSGCRVGNFPATITISVDSAAPPELRAQFPDAALQFIKDGDRIGVFLGETGE